MPGQAQTPQKGVPDNSIKGTGGKEQDAIRERRIDEARIRAESIKGKTGRGSKNRGRKKAKC